MKLHYEDLFNIRSPVERDFLSSYRGCYKSTICGRPGYIIFGNMQEIWVPKDCISRYSAAVLESLRFKAGHLILDHKEVLQKWTRRLRNRRCQWFK